MALWQRQVFWLFSTLGRPFGGMRPRRLTHWLARRGFEGPPPAENDFARYRDRWGGEFLLHPYYLIDRHIIAFGAYEAPLQRFIDRNLKPGMVCMDVGANIGVISINLARKVAPTGHVYAFEPVPPLVRRLEANIRLNGHESVTSVHEVGLSGENGRAIIRYAPPEKLNQGRASLVNWDEALTLQTEIDTRTIDRFVEDEGIRQIDFVKVDIQGGEMALLEGGARTFSELSPDLLIEVSPEDLKETGKNSRDLLGRLAGYGYAIHELREDGAPGPRIDAGLVDVEYKAASVYCTKK